MASVLLATDGVYDNFMPYLLRGQPVELYVPLIRWFMDNNAIGITTENREQVEESRKNFLCGDSCKAITDDKTIVVAFNDDVIPALKEDSYYAEPDWAKLQEAWNRKAYPHLYKNKTVAEETEKLADEKVEAEPPKTTDEKTDAPLAQSDISDVEKADTNNSIASEPKQQPVTTTAESETIEATDPAKKKSGLYNLFKKRKN